jgi:pimeloyl-ACP methyl ester carboxylesterase
MTALQPYRTYGDAPYGVALLHGGPGAAGEMAEVARMLSAGQGVLEPMQTAPTVEGQIEELAQLLEHCHTPVVLTGYSWGAWLGWFTAASYPSLVGKLILVSAGPFEERYASAVQETRMARLGLCEREETACLMQRLAEDGANPDPLVLRRFGELIARTDGYDTVEADDGIKFDAALFKSVWPEAAALRRSGALLNAGHDIRCPVVAIHGDHDPHPADGVQIPLSRVLGDFRFHLLECCGHTPWRERNARDRFFAILNDELS